MIRFGAWLGRVLRPAAYAAPSGPQALRFKLHSPDLRPDEPIPMMFVHRSAGGQNVSPALEWTNPPSGTRGFAATCFDPDAPTGSGWWHWQIFDLPPTTKGLLRGAGNPEGPRPAEAIQSRNDYGQVGYGGPAPPPGDRPHRYIFTVYALKVGRLDVPREASCAMVGFMINANKIEEAGFTAVYGR